MKIKVNLNRLSWCIEDSYWCPHALMYLCRQAEISAIASNIVNELFWFSTSTQVSLYISAVYSQSGFKSLLSDHSLLPTRVKQNVRIKILANDNLNILETRKEVKFNHCKKSVLNSKFFWFVFSQSGTKICGQNFPQFKYGYISITQNWQFFTINICSSYKNRGNHVHQRKK